MRVLVAIPARYASTRYPGKPLATLRGAGGEAKTLIRRSWDAAVQAKVRRALWWRRMMTGSRTKRGGSGPRW